MTPAKSASNGSSRRSLSDREWLALIDDTAQQMANEGELTVRLLADKTKERYGLSPSLTTVSKQLTQWRQLGGGERSRSEASELLALLASSVEPLYAELVQRAQTAAEPRIQAALAEAQTAVEQAAASRRDLAHAESSARTWEEKHNQLQNKIGELGHENATLQAKVTELDERVSQLQEALSESGRLLQEERRRARSEYDGVVTQHAAALRHHDRERQSEVDALKEAHRVALAVETAAKLAAQREREALSAAAQRESEVLSARNQALTARLGDLIHSKEQVERSSAQLERTLSERVKEIESLRAVREKLERSLDERGARYQVELDKSHARVTALENQVALLIKTRSEESMRYDRLVNSLEQLQLPKGPSA
jgi:DNA repair exonuclease SbcCD ATPase subunit